MSGFQAYCEPCAWQGPVRGDNLRSLRDYDRHQASAGHAAASRREAPPQPGELVTGIFGESAPSTIVEVITTGTSDDDRYEVAIDIGFGHTETYTVARDPAGDEHGHRSWEVQ